MHALHGVPTCMSTFLPKYLSNNIEIVQKRALRVFTLANIMMKQLINCMFQGRQKDYMQGLRVSEGTNPINSTHYVPK